MVAPSQAGEVKPSVLEAARRATAFVFADFGHTAGTGTAFCIDASAGLFITNDHVIEDKGTVGRLTLVVSPGTPAARVLSATAVKTDPKLDLAVLRVDSPRNLHPVDLASAGRLEQLRETHEVLALGYPFGTRLATVPGAAPEVSVSTSKVTALRHAGGALRVIQFDGSINPGNSGGPLLDAYGNVIGVVRAIVPGKQINFAIPASDVRTLLEEAHVAVAPPLLSDPQMAAQFIDKLLTPPAGRRPYPSPAAQDDQLELVRRLFAEDFADRTPAGQAQLAYRLLDEAAARKGAPDSRFTLLALARQAAIRAGDFPAGITAARAMIDEYNLPVPSLDILADQLKQLDGRLEGRDAADAAALDVIVIEAQARQENYAEAEKRINPTRAMAYASHNDRVISAVAERTGRVEFELASYQRAQAAEQKLTANPTDADANLAVGRYRCFVRGDFATGCTFLAKASGADLQRVAQMELAKPATAETQMACGDAWWARALVEAKSQATRPAAGACNDRAAYWYRQTLSKLTGLQRRAVAERLPDGEANAGPTTAPARHMILFGNPHTEGSVFADVAGDHMTVYQDPEQIASAFDAHVGEADDPFAGVQIIVWGTNDWRFMKREVMTAPRNQAMLRRFVDRGGDLVLCEQRNAANCDLFTDVFGVTVRAIEHDGLKITNPRLRAKADAAGPALNDDVLDWLTCFNAYRRLPADSVELARTADGKHVVAAIVPYGSGRLVLFGLSSEHQNLPLLAAIVHVLYDP